MDIRSVINHFIADCEIRGLSPETLHWYRKRLNVFVVKPEEMSGIRRIEDVNIAHLREFVQLLLSTQAGENNPRRPTEDRLLSPFTVRGYVRVLKLFFTWCYQEELIDANPSTRLKQPKAPDYLIPTFTVEQIERMLATCDLKTPVGFRDYVILLVLLDTGMRISELCSLRLADIQGSYVKVTGKGRKEREIGMHPNVARLLWRYVNKYRGVSGVRVSAHTFRHTFAKFYLERGGELFDLAREMGHSTVQVTEIYLKDYRSVEARKKHSRYSPVESIKLPGKGRGKRQV